MDPTFLTGANATFVAELYAQYLRAPSSVDPSWTAFFKDLGDEADDLLGGLDGASWAPSEATVIGAADEDAGRQKSLRVRARGLLSIRLTSSNKLKTPYTPCN